MWPCAAQAFEEAVSPTARKEGVMKYKITLSAYVTRMATRSYVVSAENEDEARQKAYDRMVTAFIGDPNVIEVGDPDVVSVEGA